MTFAAWLKSTFPDAVIPIPPLILDWMQIAFNGGNWTGAAKARAEALKEAAETAANASDSRECTDPHHDTRYCSTCQHVSLGCEVAARAIEAKMK